LAYPSITFEYYNQGKNLSKLEGGDLEKRINDLFNFKEGELIPTNEDTDIVKINGFIGTPKISKRTRGNQYLFANGRFIKDPYLNHAIISGYGNLLEEKKHPFYILFLKVDPSKIDVNIHPTKNEVKFEDGRHVYTLLQSVIKKTLGTHFVLPTDTQLLNAIDTNPSQNINDRFAAVNNPNVDQSFNPFGNKKPKTPTNWEKLDAILNTPINPPEQQTFFSQPEKLSESTTHNFEIFQIQDAYLVAKIDGELSLINQHRAHRQVLYERYTAQQTVSSQQLLFPRTLELSKSNFALYLEMQKDINALGFDISEFGQSTIIVNGLPSELSKEDGASVIIQIIDDFKTNLQDLKIAKKDALRQAAAKNAAIKTGKILNQTEMQVLLNDLMACKQKTIDQSGKPIMVKLTKQSLERFFQ
jgi:DNA mismatch repair protein MutL